MSKLTDRLKGSAAGKKAAAFIEAHDLRQRLIDGGDKAVMRLLGSISDRVSDKAIPYINRYDSDGFLEGSGYFLTEPAPGARWQLGFAKDSILPDPLPQNLYIGGYLAFPPNKADGVIDDQTVRAVALDDGSGRGLHVFAVIDCIGISNTDIRRIRLRLRELINEKNILSMNISATHCHSGVDTQGVWGSLPAVLLKNPRAVRSRRTLERAVSGRDPEFMEYLTETAAETVARAVEDLRPGTLAFAAADAAPFVRDKRPPDVTDPNITVLRFTPDGGGKPFTGVFLAAHPTNYGDKQRQISADFPYYLCRTLERAGYDAAYFQGAEAAVAANRGPHEAPGATRNESIVQYGEAVGRCVLAIPEEDYAPLPPVLNVRLSEVMIPADNALFTLLGKLHIVNNGVTKVTTRDDGTGSELYFASEVGVAEFGGALTLALIPGELMPEIAFGGACDEAQSYRGERWNYPPLRDAAKGHFTVIGLCNDAIGYIVPDNDFGSVFAPLHYEEAVSAGRRTASNIAGAFLRTVRDAEATRLTTISQQKEG